jgi:hypothetical protein
MDKIINPTIIIQSFWLIERKNKNIFIWCQKTQETKSC